MKVESIIKGRKGVLVLILLIALPLGTFFSLPYLLIAPPENHPADAIIHLIYDPHLKTNEYVLSLYKKGIARKILCASTPAAWNVYPSDYVARKLVTQGVKREDIHVIRNPNPNECLAQDLPLLIRYARKQGWKRVLLVVNPVESRFFRHLARKYFGREGIQVFVTYSPEDCQNILDRWWCTHWKAQTFVSSAMNTLLDQLYPQCR